MDSGSGEQGVPASSTSYAVLLGEERNAPPFAVILRGAGNAHPYRTGTLSAAVGVNVSFTPHGSGCFAMVARSPSRARPGRLGTSVSIREIG